MNKKIHLIYGRQGAGKSTYAQQLAKEVTGVYFSIDEWMWTLYGADLPKPMNLKWIMERVDRCEKQIWEMAKRTVNCHLAVILDIGFTTIQKRDQFADLAKKQKIETQIHYIDAPYHIRKQRVMERNKDQGETFAFEVTPGMFDFMEGEFHTLRDRELKEAIVVDTSV